MANIEQDQARLDLYAKLDEAENEAATGHGAVAHGEFMRRLKSMLR